MRSIFTFIIIFLVCNLSEAQHTERFEQIVSGRLPSRTEVVDIKFKNGVQKELGTLAVYDFENYEYIFNVGRWTKYYKNGQVLTEAEYDKFGNPLVWKLYDGKGNLLRESKALKIDTDVKEFKKFLDDKNSVDILTLEKHYKYTYKACKWFLSDEGQMLNYKKTGEWIKYLDEGKIKKVVKH